MHVPIKQLDMEQEHAEEARFTPEQIAKLRETLEHDFSAWISQPGSAAAAHQLWQKSVPAETQFNPDHLFPSIAVCNASPLL